MSLGKWLEDAISAFFSRKKSRQGPLHEVHFASLTVLEKTPPNNSIREKDFVVVVYQKRPYWALFRCPCGCGSVISLSLQKIHNPRWGITITGAGRPTLQPSVWRNNGCRSHFWIEDGYIHWCNNSGIAPWVAEPRYYDKPQ